MKLIGITGNIASGKSTISKTVARHLDVPLISVDDFSRNWIVTYDLQVKSIMQKFGIDTKDKNTLDLIKTHIFTNKSFRKHLERKISNDFWIYIYEMRYTYDLIVIEHPLMFEMDQAIKFDFIIGVDCNKNIRLDRMQKRGYDEETINHRIAAQIPFRQNAWKCDMVFTTTNNPTEEYVIQSLRSSERFKTLFSGTTLP